MLGNTGAGTAGTSTSTSRAEEAAEQVTHNGATNRAAFSVSAVQRALDAAADQ